MIRKLILLPGLILCIIQFSLSQSRPSGTQHTATQLTTTQRAGNRPSGRIDPNHLPKIGIIKGNVIDSESGKIVEYATIALFHKRLEKIMAGGITDQNGNFVVENIPIGAYQMKIEFIGYEPFIIDDLKIGRDNFEFLFKDVKISAKTIELTEVNISAERTTIINKIDRKIVTVDKDLVSAGGSAVDVLENVPSIQVDTEGNISLRGSQNVTILIDGLQSGLNSESTGAILETIPAESI